MYKTVLRIQRLKLPHKNLIHKNMPYPPEAVTDIQKATRLMQETTEVLLGSPTLSLPQSGPTGHKLELSEVGNLREMTCVVRKPVRPARRQAGNGHICLMCCSALPQPHSTAQNPVYNGMRNLKPRKWLSLLPRTPVAWSR